MFREKIFYFYKAVENYIWAMEIHIFWGFSDRASPLYLVIYAFKPIITPKCFDLHQFWYEILNQLIIGEESLF